MKPELLLTMLEKLAKQNLEVIKTSSVLSATCKPITKRERVVKILKKGL